MKMLLIACGGWLVVMLGASGQAAGSEGKPFDPAAVPAQLEAFYKQRKAVPPWRDAVKALADPDQEAAGEAAKYLVALARQSLADEDSGKAPWHATPYWGSSGENPAREMRRWIVQHLAAPELAADDAQCGAIVEVLEWFIRHEKVVAIGSQATKALCEYRSDQADALIRSLAADEGINHQVTATALQQVAARDLEVPEAVLRLAMADHHRERREAAELLWRKQTGNEPPDLFDPVRAVRSPSVRELMRNLESVIIDRPEPGAEFVRIDQTSKWQEDGEDKEEVESSYGWLLRRDGDELRILTLHGKLRDYRLGVDPEGSWYGPLTTSLVEVPVAGIVERIAKLRSSGDEEHELSEQGGFSGQFEGKAAGVPEALLAVVLYREEEWELCARVLFPALDTYADDSHWVEIVKHRLGTVFGYRMLVEFIGKRDYDAALAVAKQIDEHFKKTRFHDNALRLLEELPKRRDDFETLTLPTREAWKAWKNEHSREEQIAYLCERLRLMNCYQDVQPGDVDFFYLQYAEPSGLDENAARNRWLGKTPVINPLVELLGMEARDDEDEPREANPGMNLTIRDVPVIAPFLKDDWLVLAVGYWREFHPSRTLATTRELLDWVLYQAAGREVLSYKKWRELDEAEIAGKIEEIIKWAEKRENWSDADLLIESLEEFAKSGAPWHPARDAASKLVELGEKRAFPLIAGWLGHQETDAYDLESILPKLRKLDAGRAKPLVAEFLEHGDPQVQIEAALIWLAAGERKRSLGIIGEAFAKADYSNISDQSLRVYVPILVEDGTPAAWQALASLFEGANIATITSYDPIPLCRQLEEQGIAAGLKHFRRMLENRTSGIPGKVGWGDDTVVAYMFADKLVDGYAPHDEAMTRIGKTTKSETEERLAAVIRWLDERTGKLESQPAEGGE